MKTIAVIGCGRISNHAHFPALAQMDDVRIKYACDLIEAKAQAAKEKKTTAATEERTGKRTPYPMKTLSSEETP